MGTPAILRLFWKYYGGIDKFYDEDWELFVDCLEHAINKENEIPRLIKTFIDKFEKGENPIGTFNKKMRSAEEIMKDYGIGG